MKIRLTHKGIRMNGRARDRGCGRVARVSLAIGRAVSKKRCSFLSSLKRFEKKRLCRKPYYLNATGTGTWNYTFKGRLKRGPYRIFLRATDTAGHRSKALVARQRVR
jgi:hypothetical protein